MTIWKWFGICLVVVGTGVWIGWNALLHRPIKLEKVKGYFYPLAIELAGDLTPCLEATLDELPIILQVDLGADEYLSCDAEVLSCIKNKHLRGHVTFYGLRGKKYESPVFAVKNLRLGPLLFRELSAKETHIEFQEDAVLMRHDHEPSILTQGSVGWRLFEKMSLLLDFPGNTIAVCEGLSSVQAHGYDVDHAIVCEMHVDRSLVEFYVTVEKERMRCMLDTGSTFNLLNIHRHQSDLLRPDNMDQHEQMNPSNVEQWDFNKNLAQGVFIAELGTTSFHQVPMIYDIDAVIGMEFLQNWVVLLDFPSKKIFFLKKTEVEDLEG